MPMIGQTGGEFGFAQISDGKETSNGVTYSFPKTYLAAEIAMTEHAAVDITSDLFEPLYNGVLCGISKIVSNGQTVNTLGQSFVYAPNATKATFYGTKVGYTSAWFRFFVSFWG